ncbi:uncharacterized protein LOC113018149 [Astatotilapia calliptera]|uniref:uncharacterized protein LOC113018149 n=1 Tax=Astatotilapia calliptera TaxID=8154 RepID=UPI000E41EB49|nr:uncharacterized protein LOC113018149 [Astatotilapia calliptera]
MSASRSNNAADQRAISPDLFIPHPDFYINDFTQVDYETIDNAVSNSRNPAVFHGELEAISPAESPLPPHRREDGTISVSAYRENRGEKSFKIEEVTENIQTPPQRKEEEDDDDVIFVNAYRENCRKIPFKPKAEIADIPIQPPSATDNCAEERAEIADLPNQSPAATDNRAEERETDTENQTEENQVEEEPSRLPPIRRVRAPLGRLRARRMLHKKRILEKLAFMYVATVRTYASIYRHKDL